MTVTEGLQSSPAWTALDVQSGRATLCWTGWTTPVVAQQGQVMAVLDGHIYNRAALGTAANDAALLVALYRKEGLKAALSRINGDFALALYDADEDTLWLARDRFGVKPLYYAQAAVGFVFASRPRALLAWPGVSNRVNRAFVARFAALHYRYFDNAPDTSPYADIAQLPAAHVMCVTPEGPEAPRRYWTLEEQPDRTGSVEELAEQYRALLMDAVALRVQNAERPAFTLSGGMDSSSVLACAVDTLGKAQHAFSTVYADKTYDESAEIRSMLATHVAQWHTVPVGTPDVFSLVQQMVEVHDEPVATATWLSHYLLCQEVSKQGFATLFGGLGGDELNAGEYEHFLFHFADLYYQRSSLLDHEVERWVAYHDHPIFRKSRAVALEAVQRFTDPRQPGVCRPDPERLTRYRKALNPDYFDLNTFTPILDHPFTSYLKNRTYQDLYRETAPCCLRAEDRHAAAFNLHTILPFFDHRLATFMFRVPGHMKIYQGITKRLLRAATRGLLPEETRTRIKKTGWNAPAHVWFSGLGQEALLDLVHSRAFRERGVYDLDVVHQLIREHQARVEAALPQENHMMFLWQLVNLEAWLAVAGA